MPDHEAFFLDLNIEIKENHSQRYNDPELEYFLREFAGFINGSDPIKYLRGCRGQESL